MQNLCKISIPHRRLIAKGTEREQLNHPSIAPPRRYVIALHWFERESRFVDDLSEPRCFACGDTIREPLSNETIPMRWARCGLERCHIIAASIGGSLEPSNFLLLCHECHVEAPMTADAKFLLDWAKEHPSALACMFRDFYQALKDADEKYLEWPWTYRPGLEQEFFDFLKQKSWIFTCARIGSTA